MGFSRREKKELLGIGLAAVLAAAAGYYYFQSAWAGALGLVVGAVFGAVKWATKWAARRDQGIIGTGVTLLLGILAVYLVAREVSFGISAVPGTASVESFSSSRGQGHARVVHEVEGEPVR